MESSCLWLSEIRVPFGAVLMLNGMIETGTIPAAALASTVKEISPRPKLLPGFSVVTCRGRHGVEPLQVARRWGWRGADDQAAPEERVGDAVAGEDVIGRGRGGVGEQDPRPIGTWSSNWKPATLNDWVLVEGLSRSSSRVPAKPGGTVTFVLAGTTSTTREPPRAVMGCPMAPSSTTAAAIAPRGDSRRGRTGNLEEVRTCVRVPITASMVVGCLRKKTQWRHLCA